jgi:hypothetical protein
MEKGSRNCFVSYHHERDQEYFNKLNAKLSGLHANDYSLHSDISHLETESIYRKVREKMRSCSVTIVLIGERTGHRKWIDWEIWGSLRSYSHSEPVRSFRPSGLIGILLPVSSHSVPKRLIDNIYSGYAMCMRWEHIESDFEHMISLAHRFRTRFPHRIDNSRPRQRINVPDKK